MLKKSTLVGLAIAFIGGGIGLSIIGVTLGAHMGVSFGLNGIQFAPTIVETVLEISGDTTSDYKNSQSSGKVYTNQKGRQIVENETLPAFEKMDLRIGVSDVDLIQGEEYSIAINMDKDIPVTYEVRQGTLYVEQESSKNWGVGVGNIGGYKGMVTITIPKEAKLGDNKIETGVGDWLIQGLDMEELKMIIGVGEVTIENVTASNLNVAGGVGTVNMDTLTSDSLVIRGGVGGIEGKNLIAQSLEVESGVGDVNVEGTFNGDIYAIGGLGDLDLKTKTPEKAYNYKITKGLGTIEFNNEEIGDIENYHKDNQGEYTMKIQSGLGDITVNTGN